MQARLQLVIKLIDALVSRDFSEAAVKAGSEAEQVIPGHSAYYLHEAVTKLEAVLSSEVQALDIYIVEQKGTNSTPDMIERAEIMFPESIRNDFPIIATLDWREAGRCLVLDAPTAAGFHILRAVEAVMAEYYHHIVNKPMPTRMRNWGIYIKKLRASGKADPKITEFLDHIRENYRNPVSHPEVVLSADEAEALFGAAGSCIRQMVLAIQKIKNPQKTPASLLRVAPPPLMPVDPAGGV